MLTDIKWGRVSENALYIGAKRVFTVFLRILERLDIPWKPSKGSPL